MTRLQLLVIMGLVALGAIWFWRFCAEQLAEVGCRDEHRDGPQDLERYQP